MILKIYFTTIDPITLKDCQGCQIVDLPYAKEVVKVIKLIGIPKKKSKKPKFDWRGLWYTSQGLFVEILGIEGFILDERGDRLQIIHVDDKGFLSPVGGQLEICKGVEDKYVYKKSINNCSNREEILIEWPKVDPLV